MPTHMCGPAHCRLSGMAWKLGIRPGWFVPHVLLAASGLRVATPENP